MQQEAKLIQIRKHELSIARRAAGLLTITELAHAMKMHPSAVGRTLNDKVQVSAEFISGLMLAFPNLTFEDLLELDIPQVTEVPA